MTDESPRVTGEDVVQLNRGVLLRSARLARVVGTVLVAIGALGFLMWVWIVLRQQHVIGGEHFMFGPPGDGSPTQRLDAFAGSFGFLTETTVTAGIGALLRLAGEHLTAGHGGSLTGLAAGDVLPTAADDLPWLADESGDGDGDDPTPWRD